MVPLRSFPFDLHVPKPHNYMDSSMTVTQRVIWFNTPLRHRYHEPHALGQVYGNFMVGFPVSGRTGTDSVAEGEATAPLLNLCSNAPPVSKYKRHYLGMEGQMCIVR
jgi:hypothetical protein